MQLIHGNNTLIFTTIHLIISEYCIKNKKNKIKPGNLTAEWMAAASDALAALHGLHYAAQWGAREESLIPPPGQGGETLAGCSVLREPCEL